MNTKRFCFGLILGIWMGAGLAFAAEDAVPPRRPVQDIGARLVLARGGAQALPFRNGTVRLRLPGGALDLPLDEIQSVRYPAATAEAAPGADPDECRIVTVHGDVLVGRCPFGEFRRLLKASDGLDDDAGSAAAIAFATSADAAAAAGKAHPVTWVVRLSNGSVLHADLRDGVFSLESGAGSFRLPAPLVAAVERDAGTDLLVLRLADAPYAVRSYLPRAELRIADTAGRTLSVPWSDVASIAAAGVSVSGEPLRFSQDADVSATNAPSRTMPFPVYGLTLRTDAGDILLPSTRLVRIVRNADRTHTVFTAAGDILTGRLAFPDQPEPDASVLSAAPVRETPIAFADADRIEFLDHAAPALSDNAAAWRLVSGDILVGDWERGDGDESAAAAAPVAAPVTAAAASRIAAVASPAAVASSSTIPQARTDGSWPAKRYAVRLAASGTPLDIPAKNLEAVRPLPATGLPPARIPAGPSALASDEVLFDGGVFRLGRASGEGPTDEVPAVNVQVPPFYLANTPVTVAQFRAFVDDTGYKTVSETAPGEKTWLLPGFTQTDDDPVVCLAWIDAATYCNWRSKRAGLTPAYTIRDGGRRVVLDLAADGYRLPLEAEWEYAARNGGQDILFPWGGAHTEAEAQQFANFRPEELFLDPWPTTNPVKAFPAQPSGLYGMAGNVWEWCQDLYVPNAYATAYRSGAIESLLNPEPGAPASARVMRGGSYFNRLPFLRCTARGFGHEQVGAPRVGMRVARNAD